MTYAGHLLAAYRYLTAVSPYVPYGPFRINARRLYIMRLVQKPKKHRAVICVFCRDLKPHIKALLYRHNVCMAVKDYILSPCLSRRHHIVYMLPVLFGGHRHALAFIVISVEPVFRLYRQTYKIALPAVVYLSHRFIEMLRHSPAEARNVNTPKNNKIIGPFLNYLVSLYLDRYRSAVIYFGILGHSRSLLIIRCRTGSHRRKDRCRYNNRY